MTTLNLSPDEISDLIDAMELMIASTATDGEHLESARTLRAKLIVALRQGKRKAEEQMPLDLS